MLSRKYYPVFVDENGDRCISLSNDGEFSIDSAIHQQLEPAKVWTVQHNRNTDRVIVRVEKDGRTLSEEEIERIEISTLNIIAVQFKEEMSGKLTILFL